MSFVALDQEYVNQHLAPDACIPLMEEVLKKEENGEYIQYLRTAISLPNTKILGMMPSYIGSYFGVKVISVYHDNAAKGYPSHQGQILLFQEAYGNLVAAVDAMSVTKNRTGAVSAVATKVLARPDSKTLAVLGCGAQGESHVLAIASQFSLTDLYLWDLNTSVCERLSKKLSGKLDSNMAIHVCEDIPQTVAEADIICTVTPAAEPILFLDWVKKGAHINAVGACAPNARELASDLVVNSSFFCDNVNSVRHESGDFLFPKQEGRITDEHIKGTIGQVLNGKITGRTDREEITIFEALGMAVEDIAAAKYLYEKYSSY